MEPGKVDVKKNVKTMALTLPASGFVFLFVAYYVSAGNGWTADYSPGALFGSMATMVLWALALGALFLSYKFWKGRDAANPSTLLMPIIVREGIVISGFVAAYVGKNFAIMVPFFVVWIFTTAMCVKNVLAELET